MSEYRFLCCRGLIDCQGGFHTYIKEHHSPIAPFIGLGFIFSHGKDPELISSIFINQRGVIVCVFEAIDYGGDGGDYDHNTLSDEWLTQVEYEFGGWKKLSDDGHGRCKLYDAVL